MSIRLEVHAVVVAGFPIYTCRACGAQGRGDWFKAELGGALPTQPEVDRLPRAHHLPVGWASYGNGEYACPGCEK